MPALDCIVLLGAATVPYAACAAVPLSNPAGNITLENTRPTIAPALPVPPVGDDVQPIDYLIAARNALARG